VVSAAVGKNVFDSEDCMGYPMSSIHVVTERKLAVARVRTSPSSVQEYELISGIGFVFVHN
jgi:hypothetical protein